jgi:hypothetical protein
MWWYHSYDAYYEQQALEYELGHLSRSRDSGCSNADSHHSASERLIPLRWLAAWIGGLSVISLALGLASQWFLL